MSVCRTSNYGRRFLIVSVEDVYHSITKRQALPCPTPRLRVQVVPGPHWDPQDHPCHPVGGWGQQRHHQVPAQDAIVEGGEVSRSLKKMEAIRPEISCAPRNDKTLASIGFVEATHDSVVRMGPPANVTARCVLLSPCPNHRSHSHPERILFLHVCILFSSRIFNDLPSSPTPTICFSQPRLGDFVAWHRSWNAAGKRRGRRRGHGRGAKVDVDFGRTWW